jgi:hypothetical protein
VEVQAGKDLVIGLHPARPGREPGTAGAVQIGLLVEAPLEAVLATLSRRGVATAGPITDAGPGMRFAAVRDMDANELYLWEQSAACYGEKGPEGACEEDRAAAASSSAGDSRGTSGAARSRPRT